MRYMLVLIAVVLVALAVKPRVTCASSTRCLAYRAAIKSDLRYLGAGQQEFARDHSRYAETLSELPDFQPSLGVGITILASTETGLLVEGLHEKWPWGRCAMAAGSFAGDSLPAWTPTCTGRVR